MSLLVVDASVWVGAADASDPSSADSRAFLSTIAARQLPVALPSIARIEVACALARRLRDTRAAQRLADALLASPQVRERPLDADTVRRAVILGTQTFLRGADAIYAALTEQLGATLVAWDDELVQRAGAVTPTAWIARNP
jgi:predicted nucleic acid-binding protein